MGRLPHSNAEALELVAKRLEQDVGRIIEWAKTQPHDPPYFAIARSLFPIAESIGFLLHPEATATSARLVATFENELAEFDNRYRAISHIVCQIWRHGLIHGDEAPLILIDGSPQPGDHRAIGWHIFLQDHENHLTVEKNEPTYALLYFSLERLYKHLLSVCRSTEVRSRYDDSEISNRYCEWTTQRITSSDKGEKARVRRQVLKLLP